MTNTGRYASELDVKKVPYTDLTYQNYNEGYILRFDQRAYTTKEDFHMANLDINGFLYVPKKCADGTVA